MKVMKMIPKDWSYWQPFPVVEASNKNGEDTGRRNKLTAHLLKKETKICKSLCRATCLEVFTSNHDGKDGE